MNTAGFAGRASGLTMIASHGAGHIWATNGTLLRVDCERGIGWVATRYDRNLRVIEQVRGSDEEVHRAAARWADGLAALLDPTRPCTRDEGVMGNGR